MRRPSVGASRALGVALCLSLCVLLAGCGGSILDEARHEFDTGQYAEAKSTLLQIGTTEYSSQDWRKQTAYALLRGLVMGALGDRTEAQAWLGLAKQSEEQHPGSLSREDVSRLKLAEEQYGPFLPTTTARSPQ